MSKKCDSLVWKVRSADEKKNQRKAKDRKCSSFRPKLVGTNPS